MDKKVKNILKIVTFSQKENENDFKTTKIKFKAHFMSKKNTMHKRLFHLRQQQPRECVTFVRSLYKLADGCNFANKNKEIKDRFIIRLQDKGLSECL